MMISPPMLEPVLGGGTIHTGGPTLLSVGTPVERDDSTSSLVYLPLPPTYSTGDLLVAICMVAPQSGGPSPPMFQPFPGGYYTALQLGQSFIIDTVFGDFICNISGRIATSDANDGLVGLSGQPRCRFGQIAAFDGMPGSLTSITDRNGNTEHTATTELESDTILNALGTDTLGILASQRLGKTDGSDDSVVISAPPQGPLAMETIHTVNIPSTFTVGNLIGGWCYASRGETDARAGDIWTSGGYSSSEKTLSTWTSLKASGYS